MDDDELSARIRRHATRHAAGEPLRAAVRMRIALLAAARPVAAAGEPPARVTWLALGRGMLAGFAGGVVLTLALVWLAPRLLSPSPPADALRAEVVADHVRALGAGPLIEVASGDRHTVKPWFQGRLTYAPQVPDLTADGFPLLGGRVDRVAGAPTAALTYARHLHRISAFVWPAEGSQASGQAQVRGFNVLHWSDGRMQVWLVSDAEPAELEHLAQAWRAAVPAR